PFRRLEVFLRVVGDRVIVALTCDKRCRPTGEPPVDVLVGLVELLALDLRRDGKTAVPAAHALLRERVDAGYALGLDRGDRRRPHALERHFAVDHEVDRLAEILP